MEYDQLRYDQHNDKEMFSLVSEKVMGQPAAANKKSSKIIRTGPFGSDTVNISQGSHHGRRIR